MWTTVAKICKERWNANRLKSTVKLKHTGEQVKTMVVKENKHNTLNKTKQNILKHTKTRHGMWDLTGCYFCKLQAMSFTEERLLSGHSAIKPRSVEWWLSFWKFLESPHRISGATMVLLLVKASSRKSLGCSKRIPFKNYGGHCALGNLQCSRILFVVFHRSVRWYNPVSEHCRQFLLTHSLALLWYALSVVTV